jgi:hypothetical protein
LLQQNGVFFSAASCKKETIFGAARKNFCPFYFVLAFGKYVFTKVTNSVVAS